jgi:hypothetical protein
VGTLPESIGDLGRLTTLKLGNVGLPGSFGNLTALTELSC